WEGSGETAHVARAYAEKFADAPQDRAGLLTDLYSSASIQGRVAVLAPLFTAAVDAESAWARYHLAQSLQHWVRDLKSLAKAVGFKPTITTKVVGIGGLWSGWPGFRARAVRVMEQTWPGEFTLTEPLLAPEWGPLVLARDTFGLSIADLQHFNR
ncbi:MAG TPA: hypothetical protein PKO06_23800, partial [Candidatus Ozemobacteraceae bacterium]|nr:hypothetical protein [Candidatus Ozemobacteraceae bacterium]